MLRWYSLHGPPGGQAGLRVTGGCGPERHSLTRTENLVLRDRHPEETPLHSAEIRVEVQGGAVSTYLNVPVDTLQYADEHVGIIVL